MSYENLLPKELASITTGYIGVTDKCTWVVRCLLGIYGWVLNSRTLKHTPYDRKYICVSTSKNFMSCRTRSVSAPHHLRPQGTIPPTTLWFIPVYRVGSIVTRHDNAR